MFVFFSNRILLAVFTALSLDCIAAELNRLGSQNTGNNIEIANEFELVFPTRITVALSSERVIESVSPLWINCGDLITVL